MRLIGRETLMNAVSVGQNQSKQAKDCTDAELDQIELQSYREIDQYQALLGRARENIQIARTERERRKSVSEVKQEAVQQA